MRVLLQRVNHASVTCDGNVVGRIDRGVLALVGIHREDTDEDMAYCIGKILNAKLWKNDDDKSWKSGVVDIEGGILMVSQFTLGGVFEKGHSLDFRRSMEPVAAKAMYTRMIEAVKDAYVPEKVQNGVFGGYMDVSLSNDGPVTILIDSFDKRPKSRSVKEKEEAAALQAMRDLRIKLKKAEGELKRLREKMDLEMNSVEVENEKDMGSNSKGECK